MAISRALSLRSANYYRIEPVTKLPLIDWILYDGDQDRTLGTIYGAEQGRRLAEVADRNFPSGETTLGELLQTAGFCEASILRYSTSRSRQ